MVGPVGTSNLGSWNSHWMVVLNIFTSYFQVYNFLSTILANNPLLFPCDIPILSWFLLQSAFFRWFSVLKLDPHVHIWLYGFPWFSYGFPMIFWGKLCILPGFSHGFLLVHVGCPCGDRRRCWNSRFMRPVARPAPPLRPRLEVSLRIEFPKSSELLSNNN